MVRRLVLGLALLITVAAVDTGVVSYVAALSHNWFGWNLDAADHTTILLVTLILLAIQTLLNVTGAKVMDASLNSVSTSRSSDTRDRADPPHPRLPPRARVPVHDSGRRECGDEPLGLDFNGSWIAAALFAVLAPVYIFYGFESAGDIAEETKDAGRQIPKAMRWALIWAALRHSS